jgi:uncharacterized protein (TIGR03067 family)
MSYQRTTFAAIVLAVAMATSCLTASAHDDLKAFQGTWKPTEANLGDNKIEMMVLEKAKIVFAEDKYTVTIDEQIEKGVVALDAKKSPKQMDIFPTSGTNNGKTLWAIYEIEGDVLRVCYSLTPNVRPENFEPDSNTLLYVKYERVKDE